MISGAGPVTAVVVGMVFGIICALFGELFQRVFYAHGDTHWDPPAAAIVFGTCLVAVLAIAGVFPSSSWVPLPI
jgi:H+/Cl- antiporter ClcA